MHQIWLLRALLIIPLWFGFLFASVILIVYWIKNKQLSRTSKAAISVVIAVTVLYAYFTFIHGNLRKTTVDLDALTQNFDTILALETEKQALPYWGSATGEYYYTSKSLDNAQLDIHIIYGEMNTEFDVTATAANAYEAVFAPRFSQQIQVNDIKCIASAIYAGKDSWFGVQAFNGCYHGTIYMCKDDINIVIDYSTLREPKLIYAFTAIKTKQ